MLPEQPLFPKFKLINIEDQKQIRLFTNRFPPYSDFNFTSLFSYDIDNDVAFTWLNNNLVIKFRDYLTKAPFYLFLGTNKVSQTAEKLIKLSQEQKIDPILKLIPEKTARILINNRQFIINEDIDQNDYIIPLNKSAKLTNINKHKKQAYDTFIKTYPDYQIKKLDLTNKDTQKDMLKLFRKWAKMRKNKTDDTTHELKTLKKFFKFCNQFNLFALGIYINNKLVCYLIDERLKKPYVIGHFIKADLSFKGIYEVMNKISAQFHIKAGYKYINIEQDLGIEGLRISKMQRSPVFFLKKYIVSLKINKIKSN